MNTVFKGIINGKTYNSIDEYNEEIRRCITQGIPFSASTSTETFEQKQENPVSLLPGMDNWNSYYIDQYIDLTDDQLEDFIDRSFKAIRTEVLKMNAEQIEEYKEDIQDAFDYISGDLEDNTEGIKQTEAVIDHFQKNLDYLKKSDRIIKAFKGLYGKIKSIL